MNDYKKNILLTGAIFVLLSAIAIGLLLFSYILGAGDSSFMDFAGWLYFFFSSLMHAGMIVLIPFLLLFVPLTLLGVNPKVNAAILGTIYVVIAFILVINRFVFQIYHFHINGFVHDMLFSKGAKDIFVLSF
jgi:membrane-anchored protein YejM (alkaline phosphatase superfamily)